MLVPRTSNPLKPSASFIFSHNLKITASKALWETYAATAPKRLKGITMNLAIQLDLNPQRSAQSTRDSECLVSSLGWNGDVAAARFPSPSPVRLKWSPTLGRLVRCRLQKEEKQGRASTWSGPAPTAPFGKMRRKNVSTCASWGKSGCNCLYEVTALLGTYLRYDLALCLGRRKSRVSSGGSLEARRFLLSCLTAPVQRLL